MSVERKCYGVNKNILGHIHFVSWLIKWVNSSFVSVNFLASLVFQGAKQQFICKAFKQKGNYAVSSSLFISRIIRSKTYVQGWHCHLLRKCVLDWNRMLDLISNNHKKRQNRFFRQCWEMYKKSSGPSLDIRRKASSFYSHSQRWMNGESKQANIYRATVWNIIISQKGDIHIHIYTYTHFLSDQTQI